MSPDFQDKRPQPNDAAPHRDHGAHLSLEAARELAIQKLRELFSKLDHGEAPHPAWLAAPLTPYEVIKAQVVDRQLPVVPPSPFRNVDEDPQALPFLSAIIEAPFESSLRWEAYTAFPSPQEACAVAHALLKGGSKSRISALMLLSQASFDDSVPGCADVIALLTQALYVAAVSGSATDRSTAQSLMGLLSEEPHETWERALTYLLNSLASGEASDAERALLLTPLTKEQGVGVFCVLLGQALSRDVSRELSNAILSDLIQNPLPGTPALTELLTKILTATNEETRRSHCRLLSSIDGFCGEYWGHLAPWTFERPLRMLNERQWDPIEAHRRFCPNIGLSSFLFGCNLLDCDPVLLGSLNFGFQEKDALSPSGNQWLSSGLRQQLIRCSFLSPSEHIEGIAALMGSDLRTIDGVRQWCDILARLCVTQRREFPHLSVLRLRNLPGEIERFPQSIIAAVASAPDVSIERINDFTKVNPSLSATEQYGLFQEFAPEVLQWAANSSWQAGVLGLDPSSSRGTFASPWRGTSPICEFIRAQTIRDDNSELLSTLGEALNHFERGETKVFGAWRYNDENPVVVRQLRSLTPSARESWKRGQLASFTGDSVGNAERHESLDGKSMYLALFTDEPEIMFNLGKTPQYTAACTSYDSGAYYSKALVSYVVDAHVKSVLLFDYAILQRDIAPLLPSEFSEVIARGEISFELISKYAPSLLPAVCERALVKLVETPAGKPMLLLEPSFIRGRYEKCDNSFETLRFVGALVSRLRAGLAVRPYVNQSEFPLEELILPPSRSPGGQIENHDFAGWLGSHRGATAISASIVLHPPEAP